MFENDDMDLYSEKLHPKNKSQYWVMDHWETFKTYKESILVKDEKTIHLLIKESRHGIIIDQLTLLRPFFLPLNKKTKSSENEVIALTWLFKNTNNQLMEAFYGLPFVETVDDAQKMAKKIHAPGLNLLFANAKGDIAWWAAAKLPIRPIHVNSHFILDGASGKDDYLGFYDFSENPRSINPKSGLIVSANQEVRTRHNKAIAGYYVPNDRYRRIHTLLKSQSLLSVSFMKDMLVDSFSLTAKKVQKILLPILKLKKNISIEEKQALSIYENWDGMHLPEQKAPIMYYHFKRYLLLFTFQDELGEKWNQKVQSSAWIQRHFLTLFLNEKALWWDNIQTPIIETRNELFIKAWKAMLIFLFKTQGNDPNQWHWKNAAKVVYQHPLGQKWPMTWLMNTSSYPIKQGIETINNVSFNMNHGKIKITMGPSTRRIIDFGDIEHTWGILPTGQSGIPSDPHYEDQALMYSLGKFRSQYISKKSMNHSIENRLQFIPESP
jgi:penicillin amidase